MFKNETLVKWVVCTLLTLHVQGWAEDKSSSNSVHVNTQTNIPRDCNPLNTQYIADRDKHMAEKYSASPNKDKLKYLKDNMEKSEEKYNNCVTQDGPGGCNNAESEFTKAQAEFSGSCRGLSQAGGDIPGNIACGWNVARCDCRGLSPGDDRHTALQCSSFDATTGAINLKLGQRDTRHFATCNIAAAGDMDKLEKEVREAQKELRELEKRTPELEQQIADARSQMRDKMQEAKKQMADASKARINARAEAVKQQREALKAVAQEVTSLQEQVARIEEQRLALSSEKVDGEIALEDEKTKIRHNCHAQAVESVNRMQVEAAAKGRGDIRGDFNGMLRRVGLTNRQAWQTVAKKYYNNCMKSDVTKDLIAAANRKYESFLKKKGGQERGFSDRRKALQGQIAQKQGAVCSGSGSGVSGTGQATDTSACQAIRQFNEDVAKADAEYVTDLRTASDAYKSAAQDGQNRIIAKGKELDQAIRTLAEERMRLNNLRQFLAMKQKYAPGNLDQKDVADTQNKHSKMLGQAYHLVRCKTQNGKNCEGMCTTAFNYLKAIGHIPINGTPYANSGPTGSSPSQPNSKATPVDKSNWWGGGTK